LFQRILLRKDDDNRLVGWALAICLLSGLLLIGSGLFHGVVWALSSDPAEVGWSGPLSWRKSILFGFSGGVTMLSMAQVLWVLRRWRIDSLLVVGMSLAMLAEVGLITLQTWRGQASHFNVGTRFDASVDGWMGILVCGIAIVIFWLTVRLFSPLEASAPMRLAIRSGMAFLSISCLIGFAISAWGHYQVARGLPPELVGARGVAKFPHGIAIHALQVLPLLVVGLRWLGTGDRSIGRWVGMASMIFAGSVAYAVLETLRGRGRFELDSVSTVGSLCIFLCGLLLWRLSSARKRAR
jgi:hypothetical protein